MSADLFDLNYDGDDEVLSVSQMKEIMENQEVTDDKDFDDDEYDRYRDWDEY